MKREMEKEMEKEKEYEDGRIERAWGRKGGRRKVGEFGLT